MIKTFGLSKWFASETAVSDLNIEVVKGSVFALLGPNGAGKTTAIRMILNIVRPTSGKAEVLGCDSRQLGPAEFARIGYVSESRQLPEWMRIGGFLEYCRKFYPAWSDTEASSLVRMFELPLDRKLSGLSRGMRMKVALTAALAFRPHLLILDEPFSGLDVLVRERLLESIAERTAECTVLIATHDLSDIESLATHVGYLSEGRLLFSEEMSHLAARFREIEVLVDDRASPFPQLPENLPATWLNARRMPGMIRFAHTAYDSQVCVSEVRQILPGVSGINVSPLPLRSIFVALASKQGPGGNG